MDVLKHTTCLMALSIILSTKKFNY
uniref:Uncharacterized protein n=1 Tax=Anguilla anguilla TaxID=7936 RepID=A0A0E9XPY2_ANGAN